MRVYCFCCHLNEGENTCTLSTMNPSLIVANGEAQAVKIDCAHAVLSVEQKIFVQQYPRMQTFCIDYAQTSSHSPKSTKEKEPNPLPC